MTFDKATTYYVYKCSHPVATIHWAACPHCMHGMGQNHWPRHKKFDDEACSRGWAPLHGHKEDDVILLVKSGHYRFCGYCCRDLRDGGMRKLA